MLNGFLPGPLLAAHLLPPEAIEVESRRRMAALVPGIPSGALGALVSRLLYSCGDPTLLLNIRVSARFIDSAVEAVRRGAPLIVDVRMVEAGLDRNLLSSFGCDVLCGLNDGSLAERSQASGVPRTALGLAELARSHPGALAVIGNAPTALLALLDELDAGRASPAAVIGIPVGLVAASESKELLVQRAIPYLTVLGSRGGSGLAVSAVNTILRLAAFGDA